MNRKQKVVVGMSGGVDSSVTALLLVEQGYEVLGVTLLTWKEAEAAERSWMDRSCCKIGLARYVAERLGIPYQVIDAQQLFHEMVVQNFLDEYTSGRTPNPCVLCNEKVKFGMLSQIASDLGADYLATGHYARVEYDPGQGRYLLRKGIDTGKDQSYFLYRLSQDQLSRVLFPLGSLEKKKVWRLANRLDFPVEEVAESQEICFVTEKDYRGFIKARLPVPVHEGQIVNQQGEHVGRHDGIAFYTVGQRKGLALSVPRLGGPPPAQRLYVTGLDPARNQVVVGPEHELYHRQLTAGRTNWIQIPGLRPGEKISVTAKIRYRAAESEAVAQGQEDGRLRMSFTQPQRAITPGQSVVLYRGDYVLGGGVIEAINA